MFISKALKFSALLVTAAVYTTHSSAASIATRNSDSTQEALSIIFYQGQNLTGQSFTPAGLLPETCITLSKELRDTAESVTYTASYSCIFFQLVDCGGPGITFPDQASLAANITTFPDALYQGVEAFFCGKTTINPGSY